MSPSGAAGAGSAPPPCDNDNDDEDNNKDVCLRVGGRRPDRAARARNAARVLSPYVSVPSSLSASAVLHAEEAVVI